MADFRKGFEKVAFGPKDVDKVLSLAKKIQLPKASSRVVPVLAGGPSKKKTLRDFANTGRRMADGKATKAFSTKDIEEVFSHDPSWRILSKNKGPAIFPGKDNLERQLRSQNTPAANAPEIPKKQKKFLHSIVKGHELDETKVKSNAGATHLGHRSPDVIYREHNRLVTASKDNKEAIEFMKRFREGRESMLFPDRIRYGEGQRLSRHARRRLSELNESKVKEAITRELKRRRKPGRKKR